MRLGEMMTEDELAAIEARAQAATPGPWRATEDDDWGIYSDDEGLVAEIQCCRHTPVGPWPTTTFVAHARTDVPALLAEVRRLRQERQQLLAVARAAFEADGRTVEAIMVNTQDDDALALAIRACPPDLLRDLDLDA